MYGKQWWQLDSALALCGYKWYNPEFCLFAVENFINAQKDDGRICLWGKDLLPSKEEYGEGFPEQIDGLSSLPKIFDVTYHIIKGSTNLSFNKRAYNMLKKYLEWWFDNRLDVQTGLLSACYEGTFVPYLDRVGEYIAVDTNVEV